MELKKEDQSGTWDAQSCSDDFPRNVAAGCVLKDPAVYSVDVWSSQDVDHNDMLIQIQNVP